MLSDDGGNPLAEVGLALSMAFFSLMIIMLVAILNSSPNKQQVKMDKEGASQSVRKWISMFTAGSAIRQKSQTPEYCRPARASESFVGCRPARIIRRIRHHLTGRTSKPANHQT